MIYILLALSLGQFIGHSLVQWWIKRHDSPPALPAPSPSSIWSENNDNWHEDTADDEVWHVAPTNEWEASAYSTAWWTPLPTTLPLMERQHRKIENLKP